MNEVKIGAEDLNMRVNSESHPRLVLPSRVLSRFVIKSPQALLNLLIDIGVSFSLPVGIMGHNPAAYSSGLITAILRGSLASGSGIKSDFDGAWSTSHFRNRLHICAGLLHDVRSIPAQGGLERS